jgi:hypothetical protein
MLDMSSFLSLPDGLEVTEVSLVEDLLCIHIEARAEKCVCPLCSEAATHVRCYYTQIEIRNQAGTRALCCAMKAARSSAAISASIR